MGTLKGSWQWSHVELLSADCFLTIQGGNGALEGSSRPAEGGASAKEASGSTQPSSEPDSEGSAARAEAQHSGPSSKDAAGAGALGSPGRAAGSGTPKASSGSPEAGSGTPEGAPVASSVVPAVGEEADSAGAAGVVNPLDFAEASGSAGGEHVRSVEEQEKKLRNALNAPRTSSGREAEEEAIRQGLQVPCLPFSLPLPPPGRTLCASLSPSLSPLSLCLVPLDHQCRCKWRRSQDSRGDLY